MGPEKRTYCRICEAACGLVLERDEASGTVRLRPDKEHPLSGGFVCAKGLRFVDVARDASRVLRPRLRNHEDAWQDVTWDEALGTAAARLRAVRDRYGPHAIGIYFGNPLVYNTLGTLSLAALKQGLGTRNVYSSGSQDCNNKFVGSSIVYGSPLVHPTPDFEHAKLAILLGTNPLVSQSSFVHLEGSSRALDRMKERGGELVFVDPRRTESARRWGEHVAIRPGTDVWLLLALLREIGAAQAHAVPQNNGLDALLALADEVTPLRAEEHTGIASEQIVSLAARILRAESTAFHMSVGVNFGGFGTLSYVALQALAYLSNSFAPRGGMVFSPTAQLLRALSSPARHQRGGETSRIGSFAPVLDNLPAGILADEIETPGDGQIRALIVVAADPLRSVPGANRLGRAFAQLDTVICIDLFENATSEFADVFLPTTSWLERGDVAIMSALFQQSALVQATGAVMAPPGETRTESAILAELLRRTRPASLARGAASLLEWLGGPLAAAGGQGFSLPSGLVALAEQLPKPAPRFWSNELEIEAARLRREVPASKRPDDFRIVTRRRRLGHNSWLHDAGRASDAEDVAWISEEDAKRLGVERGARIRLSTDAGSLDVSVAPERSVPAGVVILPHGLPGSNINAILPSGPNRLEPASGQHLMTGVETRLEVLAPTPARSSSPDRA